MIYDSLLVLPVFISLLNLGIHGHTYPIDEPDLLTEIEQKGKDTKVPEDIFNEKIRESYKVDLYLPDVKEHRKNRIEMTYAVPEDLVIDGNVVAKKGEVIKVLEKVKLITKYLFIKDHQMPLFLKLVDKDRNIAAVVIQGDLFALTEQYPYKKIYMGSRQLISKFGLTGVPSLVYQDGVNIIVEEIPYVTKH